MSLRLSFIFAGSSASEKKAYLFLRKEVPVRLANIMKEINLLPEPLLQTNGANIVIGWSVHAQLEKYIQFQPFYLTLIYCSQQLFIHFNATIVSMQAAYYFILQQTGAIFVQCAQGFNQCHKYKLID